ncbi:iron-sulfur cluster assembly scaffold protein [Rubrobacter naiadicus]|uniref:iron-sulfur cluster assembly scaffold protein n=1 Tax=Rubrobacter naiadicus TaxID=1392641 RepID=UPI002361B049|nr:iron-sulfur cluster assembly scaffold protein [Rubrobacter naiadicus]
MDRNGRIKALVDHRENPHYKGVLPDADVAVPGGSPECGGSVVIYLKGGGEGEIEALSFTGEGDTISMGATSMALDLVMRERLTMDQVLALDYDEFIDRVGRDVVGSRTRNATLGLSTLKAAIRKYREEEARRSSRVS